MRSKKLCYILLSALFIMLGLSLDVCSDTNALQHDLVSIPYFTPYFLYSYTTDSSTGNYIIDWDNLSLTYPGSSHPSWDKHFTISFNGDAYYSDLTNLNFTSSLSNLNLHLSNSQCSYSSLSPTFTWQQTNVSLLIHSSGRFWFPRAIESTYPLSSCYNRQEFGSPPTLEFNSNSISAGNISCNKVTNGAVCDGLWDTRNYVRTQLLPYSYNSDGFYLKSSSVDSSSGIHFNHSFKFSDLFNQKIKQFSNLTIPLYNYDDFWIDGNNFTEGRSISFNGIFRFDEPFTLHENISTNGSFVRLYLYGFSPSTNSIQTSTINCSNRNIGLENQYQFEFSCPAVLEYQYTWLYPVFEISGNGNYFWTTEGETYFSNVYIVTDNDTTPGRSLGNNLTGNYIIGDAKNDIQSDDNADWTSSLLNLFNFNMINPFAPIFSLFTSQESCAQIPTLSEFLHSEETQVCPFFSSRIRSVVTPVLGLSAMMLVFGFAVRWLGARSGNFFEDSGSIAPPGDFPAGSAGVKHVGWRRK